MRVIENQNFPKERDLYASKDLYLKNCTFDGEEDGESALKESNNIKLDNCYMNLRYPLWHNKGVSLKNTVMTKMCRAALWYSDNIYIASSELLGIKALRECKDIKILKSKIESHEFGWRSHNINIESSEIESEYLFLMASDIEMADTKFKGKYSFQYAENAVIENSFLDTKDAFWHSKNVTVKNSVVKGEYLGWYSDGLTFINCEIIGTQPLCYCKNLKLINCKMLNTDLSFEYSDVEADIKGEILSVKNPRSGKIIAEGIKEIILTDDSKYSCKCEIVQKSLK